MRALIRSNVLWILCFLLYGCSGGYAPVVKLGVGPRQAPSTYHVRRGDTLYSIAWTYGLDYRQLATQNQLNKSYHIWPGQPLKLKQQVSPAQVKPNPLTSDNFFASKHASSLSPGHWRWPTKGQIIQGFEPGFAGNAGVDIRGHMGQPVLATRSGVVVYSGDGVRGYGNLIIIKHSSDFLSAYAFNRQNLVRVGSRIRQGQKVAVMGRDRKGRAVLHFEIRKNGQPINPLHYLS